MFSEQVKRTSK